MEFIWIIIGIIYVLYKLTKERLDTQKSQEIAKEYSMQFKLILETTEELSKILGYPINEIPLTSADEFVITRYGEKTFGGYSRRDMYAIALILQRRGKFFLPEDPLKTAEGAAFVEYIASHPKDHYK